MRYKKRIITPKKRRVPIKDDDGKIIGRQTVYIGKKRIKGWVDSFNNMKKLGLRVPAPWRHEKDAVPVRVKADDEDNSSYNNAGYWDKMWQDKEGALWGEVDVPRKEDVSRIGNTVQEVSLLAPSKPYEDGDGNVFEDAITHVALVTHPVAADPENNFEEVKVSDADKWAEEDKTYMDNVALCLSMGPDDDSQGDIKGDNSGAEEVRAKGATVQDVVKQLREVVDLNLPDDTDADNILERIVVALAAIKGKEEEEDDDDQTSVKEPAKGAKEQPGPVAMSKELELALDFLGGAKVVNPKTGKSYTEKDLKALAAESKSPTVRMELSQEDNAAISWARKTAMKSYQRRIEQCVANGQVSVARAKKLAEGLKGLSLSFDEKGDPKPSEFDMVLENWEDMPRGSALTGHSPTSARNTAKGVTLFGAQAFSLGDAVREQPGGLDADEGEAMDFDGISQDMDEGQIDDILAIQFANSGKSPDQVEGGYTVPGTK